MKDSQEESYSAQDEEAAPNLQELVAARDGFVI